MFLGRSDELKILYKAEDELLKGKGFLYFISGIKGTGKTALLNQFSQSIKDIDVIYIDIKRLSLSPDLFSLYFIGNIFFSIAGKKDDKTNYFNETFQKKFIEGLNNEKITRHIAKFYEELQSQKPDYELLLKLTFQLPSVISQSLSIPLVILLDEFQELSFLSNYRIDPYKLFKTSIDNSILWILASSKKSPWNTIRIVSPENSIALSPLSYEDIKDQLLNFEKSAKERLFEITGGIPYPLFVLLENLKGKEIVDSSLVDRVFMEEVKDNGRLYHYCEQMMDSAISEARGEGLIRTCLISLARNSNANLATISRDIRRSPGVTKSLLSRLIETEIIASLNKKYFIPNRLLNLWINIYYYGKMPEIKDPIIEMLKSFNGQRVPGEIFGKEKDFPLPLFSSIDVRDGGLIVAQSENEMWLIKVKERGIAQDWDIEELKLKGVANSKIWFISMDGFSSDVFFAKKNIMLSIGDDIQTLQEILENSRQNNNN